MRRVMAVAAALLMTVVLVRPAAAANLLTNAGFESGSLSGWSCAGGSVVTSPVHAGTYALSASDYGRCAQTVTVRPNTTYTVSAWVRGNPV
ncbi:MAG: carbohydrate binding domain-containing protein, partial [Actinomycetota bacterium]|nr:carbohydrate binding domain-containing protein [Actinomycetota bacterium]